MSAVRVMVASGSARTGSLNLRLAVQAARTARERGAEVTEVDLRALGLPVYDGDIEAAGEPEGALELRRLFAANDALIIVAPEYNAFVTPLLVNSLDWASRPSAGDGLPSGLQAMAGTVVGLLSASPGAVGGMRALVPLRSFLSMSLAMLVVPQTFSLGKAHEAFGADGRLLDAAQQVSMERVVDAVLTTAAALKAQAPR